MSQSVAILLGTYNGEKYLGTQLDSIEAQTFKNWRLIASDDGSTDQTVSILESYRERWGADRLEIRKGPQKGFCQNFLSMAIDSGLPENYFAFCDQDDVWLPHKLATALSNLLAKDDNNAPWLFCTRTTYVDEDLKPSGASPLFVYPKTFRNALVQSVAGGNTMVFNQAAKRLLEKAGVVDAVSHDWWIYQLVTGAGGSVEYDPNPSILYRQHPDALVGGKTSLFGQIKRFCMLIRGRFKEWNDVNIQALMHAKACLNHSAADTLELFVRLRECNSIVQRLRMLEVCGLYRQTWRETVTLIFAAAIKKI